MNENALRRLFGPRNWDISNRRIAERRNHQFSDSIGGDSSNYVEPKFGTTRGTWDEKTNTLKRDK